MTIAVAGCGMVTPHACGSVRDVLRGSAPPRSPSSSYWAVPDAFADQFGLAPEVRQDRGAWMAAVAMTHALEQAGVDLRSFPPERIALVLGSTFAGQLGMMTFADEVRAQSARFVSPIHFPQTVGNYSAGVLSRAFGIHGPNLTLSSGPSAGLRAIITACGLLNDGSADVAIAGGVEVLSEDLVRGLGNSGGEHPALPWSEGACLYLLQPAPTALTATAPTILYEWSSETRPSTSVVETYDATPFVGRSFAVESATRLALAGEAVDGPPERLVCCRDSSGAGLSVRVRVTPRR